MIWVGVHRKTVLPIAKRAADVGSSSVHQNFELTLLTISLESLLGFTKELKERNERRPGSLLFPCPASPH